MRAEFDRDGYSYASFLACHVMSIMDVLRWPNALAAYLEEMSTRYTDGEE